MKAVCTTIIFSILFFLSTVAHSDTAIIPYKILNPSSGFSGKMSTEYAKLFSTAAAIRKGIEIYSFRQLELDLKSLSINPKRIITKEDLVMLGKSINVDYILLGNLSKIGKKYLAESMLYSVSDKKVVSKSRVKSDNLFRLVEKDVNDIFFKFPDKERNANPDFIDATLLIDMSYNISKDWDSVKKGVINFSRTISGNWSIDTRVNIIPFSDGYSIKREYVGLSSHLRVDKILKQLKPRGKSSGRILKDALRYSVKNIPWRRDADKVLVIISNSPALKSNFLERYAMTAKRGGIAIYTISLGFMGWESIEELRQLSVIGKGQHKAVAYHQRLYNADGKAIDLFMEAGRLFHSLTHDNRWQNGLFENVYKNISWQLRMPISFVDEIYYDNKNRIDPYNMLRYYPVLTTATIINSEQFESNIVYLMKRISDSLDSGSSGNVVKNVGKAMLSDGKVSVWIKINKKKDLDFFEKREEAGYFFPVGIVVQENPGEPYGISFKPDLYITGLTKEYIPDIIRSDLKKIIIQPHYYMSNGLFRPPVWFVDVKVEMIEKYKKIYDVRDKINP